MIFTTDNSSYEIDHEHHQIRRLEGRHRPTLRQGFDGVWRTYETISPIVIGSPVVIIWATVDGIHKGTHTSPVRQIIEAVN